MNNDITIITPTGDRKDAFNLLQKWYSQQTLKAVKWIVIDDGSEQLEINCKDILYIKREKQLNEPKHTLLLNLETALRYVETEKIIIWEDDEYYGKKYIETISEKLNNYDLVGISCAKYYHIKGKYYRHENHLHSSLAQTSFKSNIIPDIKNVLNGDCFVDMRIWRLKVNKHLFNDNGENLYVGMKGIKGRSGIGAGHNYNAQFYINDNGYEVLKKWIPEDYGTYLEYIESNKIDLIN